MADISALENRIRAFIKANNNQEITGPVTQRILLDIADSLNEYLEAEVTSRQDAVAAVQDSLNNSVSNLNAAILQEAITRSDADNAFRIELRDLVLQINRAINQEASARSDADDALGARITNEINQERNRAEAAFDKLDIIDTTGQGSQSEQINILLRKNDNTDEDPEWRSLASIILRAATTLKAGLMSANDKASLNNCLNNVLILSHYISIINTLISQISDDSFNVTDQNGYVGMKYDANGLDVALLSNHFKELIRNISGIGLSLGITSTTAYRGDWGIEDRANITKLINLLQNVKESLEEYFSVTDQNGYIGMKYDANGLDVALLSNHFKELIRNIPGIGGGASLLTGNLREVAEDGFFLVDQSGYISACYTPEGSIGFGGNSYDVIKEIDYA